MHKRRTDFDPLKFTPKVIHNKVILDKCALILYFEKHSLKECASYFGCAEITIKRKLRTFGVDTNKHNNKNSEVMQQAIAKRRLFNISKDELEELYIERNLDTKTIAEIYNVCFNTVRKMVRRYGLKKTAKDVNRSMISKHIREHGIRHPSQRPDVLAKTRSSSSRVKYEKNGIILFFRSLHELSFALLCDKRGYEWFYEDMVIPYVDMMSGKHKAYIIDFTVIEGEKVEWIEVKPKESMIPEDKRIYAERRAQEAGVVYRGLEKEEIEEGYDLFLSGYNQERIFFYHNTNLRRTLKKKTFWFKIGQEMPETISHLKRKYIENIGVYMKAVYRL